MAGKRFHITPNGPKRCTAKFRPCPFSDHYGSEEAAAAADRVIQRNNAFRSEVRRLEESHQNPTPMTFSRSSFIFGDKTNSPREFGEEIDARVRQFGVKPEIYHSMGQFMMNNGNGMEVNVQVMRMTEIDKDNARVVGVWRVIRKENKFGLFRQNTVQDIIFDFSTEKAAKRSMLQVREFFRTAAISSGIYDEDRADATADNMFKEFKQMFNAVESDAAGDFDLWDRGMGYFTESDSDTIVVNEDYKTSAFRAENFRNFITNCPYYKSTQPEAEIKVSETNPFNGVGWTFKKESGQWIVEKSYADGFVEVAEINSAQEAMDHVYYHNIRDVYPGREEEALKKGNYAVSLFNGVEKALEENKAVVEAWWENTSSIRNKNADNSITKDIYDLENEPKGSLMGKIFDTYT